MAVTRLLESAAKRALASSGVCVPRGIVATTAEQAFAAAAELGGRVAVKALVPANRRGAHGGVRFAETAADAAELARALLGGVVHDWSVDSVLVETYIALEQELYFSVSLDTEVGAPVAVASLTGGIDVEATAAQASSQVLWTEALDVHGPVAAYRVRELWRSAGLPSEDLMAVSTISKRIADMFFALDATLIEVNPLGLTAGADGRRAIAVGALMSLDDCASHRRTFELDAGDARPAFWRDLTSLEREAAAVAAADPYRGTARFIQLDGDIALITGGGGGSLVLTDAVLRAGGRPACYTEIGGNPTADKVRGLTRVALSCPGVKGLLVGHNITNNTQVDLVAEGVVAALQDCRIDTRIFPVCAREVGTHDLRGTEVFHAAGVECLGEAVTLEDAARRIVDRVTSRGAP